MLCIPWLSFPCGGNIRTHPPRRIVPAACVSRRITPPLCSFRPRGRPSPPASRTYTASAMTATAQCAHRSPQMIPLPSVESSSSPVSRRRAVPTPRHRAAEHTNPRTDRMYSLLARRTDEAAMKSREIHRDADRPALCHSVLRCRLDRTRRNPRHRHLRRHSGV